MRGILAFLILIFILSIVFSIIAKAGEKIEAPPGMEVIEISGVKYIVPKGTEVRKKGGVLILEGHNEYVARRFSAIEERLGAVEREIEELKRIFTHTKKE